MDTALKVSQIGASLGYPDHLRGRAEDGGQRPAAHRLLPGLRLGRQVRRGLHARGGAGCRLDGAHLHQGVRAGSDGAARRLDRRGRRACRPRRRTSRRTSSCSRKCRSSRQVPRRACKQCVTDFGYCVIVVSEGAAYRGRQVPRRRRHQGRLRPHAARRRRPRWSPTWCARRTATSTTGRWPTICSAPRATSPRRSTSSRRTRSARRRSNSRCKGVNAVMPTIVRKSSKPYRWVIGHVPLAAGRQQGEEAAARLHPRGRLRHHRAPAGATSSR